MITKLEVNGPSQYDHLKCATREEVKKSPISSMRLLTP